MVQPYGLQIKLYADDSQLYISLLPTDADNWTLAKERIEECLRSVKAWMNDHWPKCNEAKTEFLLLGKSSAMDKMEFVPTVDFGGVKIRYLLWIVREKQERRWECIWTPTFPWRDRLTM